MNFERLNADVRLEKNPRNGIEAHRMVVDALTAEIEEKQMVLRELLNEDIKQKFIRQWTPDTRNVNIYDME